MFLLILLYTMLFLLIQRSEAKKRRLVLLLLLPIVGLIHWYANLRELGGQSNMALATAVVFNLLFWILIGRYNPVGSSDDIQVLGLDD